MTARALLIIFGVVACGGGSQLHDAGTVGDDATDAGDGRTTIVEVPVTPNRELDLLFVIDDSPSMADKQLNLVSNFPSFINALNSAPGGLPNVHIGVVTTDMGTRGSGSVTPGTPIGQVGNGGCSGPGKAGVLQVNGASASVTGNFISDIKLADGSRVLNYTGTLNDVFGQMARAGAGGCGFEQPLAAMRAALENTTANAGFLRPDALLGVIFLTDEDDCSVKDTAIFGPDSATLGPLQSFRCTRFGVTCGVGGATSDEMNTVGTKAQCGAAPSSLLDDVASYHQFLVGLKGDARKVVVSAIMGAPEPVAIELRLPPGGGAAIPGLAHSCSYQSVSGPEVADPGVRLKAFLDQFPERSTLSTVCQANLAGELNLIGDLVDRAIGSPCVNQSLPDTDPTTPGSQPDCIVEDVVGGSVTPIAACDASNTPTCWRLVADALNCVNADHLSLDIVRSGAPNPATVTRMRCIIPT